MPVMGVIPIVMPTFSKIWNSSMASTPTHSRVPNSSLAWLATRHVRQSTRPNRASSVVPPTKPSSSPTAVKIKSVCCSGTKERFVCVPRNTPLPVSPPAAMAIWDWRRLYAERWVSPAGTGSRDEEEAHQHGHEHHVGAEVGLEVDEDHGHRRQTQGGDDVRCVELA